MSNPEIKWNIVSNAHAYAPGHPFCDLCTTEKLCILKNIHNKHSLNKRNEICKMCPHRDKFSLGTFRMWHPSGSPVCTQPAQTDATPGTFTTATPDIFSRPHTDCSGSHSVIWRSPRRETDCYNGWVIPFHSWISSVYTSSTLNLCVYFNIYIFFTIYIY